MPKIFDFWIWKVSKILSAEKFCVSKILQSTDIVLLKLFMFPKKNTSKKRK